MAEMRTGTLVSGALHGVFVAAALFGLPWIDPDDQKPLTITEVEFIDSAQFDARLSTAPVVQNQGPAEMMAPQEKPAPDLAIDDADTEVARTETRAIDAGAPPEDAPDQIEIVMPAPPVNVPTEAPKPTIAEIPIPDALDRQALAPESPEATELQRALSSSLNAMRAPNPSPPPPPDTTALAEREPPPEETEVEPEPEAVAAAEPEAPEDLAPQEARLPVARPAEVAAAGQASSDPTPKAEEKEPEEKTAEAPKPEAETAEKPKAKKPEDPKPAGGSTSTFAARLTQGEKEAFQLALKKHFTDAGQSAPGLWVKIEVRLSQDGRIVSGPTLLGGGGGDGGQQDHLFKVGRRTLLKAQNAGEFSRLPADKYDGWQLIHVTFTPEEIEFSS